MNLNNAVNTNGNHLCDDNAVYAHIWDSHSHAGDFVMTSSDDYWTVTISSEDLSAYDTNFSVDFQSEKYYPGAYGTGSPVTSSPKAETDIYNIRKGYNYQFSRLFPKICG